MSGASTGVGASSSAAGPVPNPLPGPAVIVGGGAAAPSAAAATAAATTTTVQQLPSQPSSSQHAPSLAGSVLEASDGLGGKTLIRVQNISSTANLGVRLDLKQIALRCRNTEFNPRRFGAVIMRLREPRATALIFASGKMCVTGTKSVHNSTLATKQFAYIIERVGFKPQPYIDFKVQNMVGTADVGFPIRLEGLVYAHSKYASYEPELFPGLIYRLVESRVVFLIFVSGKIVITGAKTELDLCQALKKVYPVCVEFRKAQITSIPGIPNPGEQQVAGGAGAPAKQLLPSSSSGAGGGSAAAAPSEMEEV